MVYEVARAVKIPLMGIGGVASIDDVMEFLVAGATAVQIALRMVDHPEQMPNLRGSVKTLPALLVVGKSTGPAPRHR